MSGDGALLQSLRQRSVSFDFPLTKDAVILEANGILLYAAEVIHRLVLRSRKMELKKHSDQKLHLFQIVSCYKVQNLRILNLKPPQRRKELCNGFAKIFTF